MTDRKKFKETVVGKVLIGLISGAINVSLPDLTKFFDRNNDGTVNYKDLTKLKWFEILGAIAMIITLFKLEIIDVDAIVELVELLLNSN